MVVLSKICATAFLASSVFAAPAIPGPMAKFAEIKTAPTNWVNSGRADGSAMLQARIGIKQKDITGLQQKLLDISNPNSANYGKWLSQEQIQEYTAPDASHVAAITAWLTGAGIKNVSHNHDWIEFSAPISQMESLLNAKYEWYTHVTSGAKLPRTQQYSIPKNLHGMIDVVTPTTALYHNLAPHEANTDGLTKRAGGATATPDFIRQQYNVDYKSTGSQTIAVTSFQNVGASHSDYSSFSQKYNRGLKDFRDIGVNGGSNNGDGSEAEGNLDTQYASALAAPNPAEYLAVGPYDFGDGILAFSQYLNSASNPPSVVSSSYGDTESNYDGSYMDRACNEFMKAGSRGISILFSSGDSGVGGNKQSSCSNGFYGLWPAVCPYVTAVGGTDIINGVEKVVDFGQYNKAVTSAGGGYSQHFTAPDYNANVTAAYAQSVDPATQQMFNAGNRGFPDISLVSALYPTVINGKVGQLLGTSASSPAIAGMFSLINDYRKSKGQPTLGFLNPLLYSGKVDAAIRDVTEGNNYGCDSDGFYASTGWDAASGLGTLDFAKFRSLV
ncbi:hypothetical protein NLG97_g4417 [Lecanicillium saksenae]|uniref:Uncharacterized protein n=1 Tax=Lecanicillium saksenae TaxID=468837 RepID=A0ACC1QWP7_9HYPO|nr:hypothetical protein NLG97_g4417 [Lecanicillium saksenae]